MSVSIPPSDAPMESGISSSDGLSRALHPSDAATGSITATVPVELMNAESAPAPSMSTAVSPAPALPAAAPMARPNRSAVPVRDSAAADDEQRRDHHHDGVGEARERLGQRHDPREREREQRQERDEVQPEPVAGEEEDRRREQGEDEEDVSCHREVCLGCAPGAVAWAVPARGLWRNGG